MATSCCGVKKPKLNAAGDSSSVNCCNNTHQCLTGGLPGGSQCCANGLRANGMSMVADPSTVQPTKQRVINAEMVIYCFDVLYSYLHNTESPKTPKFSNDHFPLFVTWKLGKDKKLRGCIGTFNSTSLHQGLREYAITSACKDSRFDPITPDDFSRLHCSISLLLDFEVAEHYLDWEIGIHGIRIEFNSEKGAKKAATYLPEVAVEQGWNQIQTIDSLLRKGGFKGTITPETRTSVCLIRFQSEKVTVSYAEYMAHKQGYNIHDESSSSSPSNGFYSNGYHHQHQNGIVNNSHHTGSMSSHGTRSTTVSGSGSGSILSLALRFGGGGGGNSNGYVSGGGHYRSYGRSSSPSNSNSQQQNTADASQRNSSHHPSPNAARYLPLPSHPYMPPSNM